MRSGRRKFDRRVVGRIAFTLVELLVVIAIIGVLLGLLLPSMRVSSGAARRMACANQFKHLGLAVHNYHSAYKQLPFAMGGTEGGTKFQSNQGRASGLVSLLPFLEQQSLWNEILMPSNQSSMPPMGPAPWVAHYDPWLTTIPTFLCPAAPSQKKVYGMTNFALCIGDRARSIHQPDSQRGVFGCYQSIRFAQITDGLSNTVAMLEIGTPVERHVSGQFAWGREASVLNNPDLCTELLGDDGPRFYDEEVTLADLGRGGRWCDGSAGYTLANTILPPNSASCSIGGETAADGIYSAGSYHSGGCHRLMGDGAVVFTTDSIDAGDPNAATLAEGDFSAGIIASPHGVWGAMGTVSAGEDINDQLGY